MKEKRHNIDSFEATEIKYTCRELPQVPRAQTITNTGNELIAYNGHAINSTAAGCNCGYASTSTTVPELETTVKKASKKSSNKQQHLDGAVMAGSDYTVTKKNDSVNPAAMPLICDA
jgi:flagellar capping protein FliD